MAENEKCFKVGDYVRLEHDFTTRMTVIEIKENGDKIRCQWKEKMKFKEKDFLKVQLVLAKDEDFEPPMGFVG